MGMSCAGINLKFAHHSIAKRTSANHTLDSLFNHALWVIAIKDLTNGTAFDTASIARMPEKFLVCSFVAGEGNFLSINDDDIVPAINVRGKISLVLAAKAIGNDGGKTPKKMTTSKD
jgi:hypothetical protein